MKIAIDGPAGAGKSTVAKGVSKRLGFNYLDTGAMYRAAALFMLNNKIELNDEEAINSMLPDMHMDIFYEGDVQHVIVNGDDVTEYIRTDIISNGASAIAIHPKVRLYLVELQRNIADKYNIIMDGRDIGTYVLPQADFKFYLTAETSERAKRRYLQNGENNTLSLLEIEEEIKKRDFIDMNRKFAPLKVADDAILIDTTNLSVEEAENKIIKIVNGV